jgi:hypothetical protein
MTADPISFHRDQTKQLAASLRPKEVYQWLIRRGYFPESYVLPPCFAVTKAPEKLKRFFTYTAKNFQPPIRECVEVNFPKTPLTDRRFGIIDPEIHNDICFHIASNWKTIVKKLIPTASIVTSYSFPVPLNSKFPSRVGELRSGRMIYEFIHMTDDDLASVAYEYEYLVKTDIKNFYPSIYTHSIAWAIHGKNVARNKKNRTNYSLLGNRLDKLFQNANDGCTVGVPIGSVVADIIGELIASSVDIVFSKQVKKLAIDCRVVRFKDDYRILVKNINDSKRVISALQIALKEFKLELNDEKTKVFSLPSGLFRDWVSKYHDVHPYQKTSYRWKEFREIYLAVIEIDKEFPNTGVIDRFLADILSKEGHLKLRLKEGDLDKAISMLLMLGSLRVKAFPKILGILESILRDGDGFLYKKRIFAYLENYMATLLGDEDRNKYLISWLAYFLKSNGYNKKIANKFLDPIVKSVVNGKSSVFNGAKDFKIYRGIQNVSKEISLLEHLDIFNPPINLQR